ncbi:hypothetical protein MML48_5g00018399 [Holotrichia oblita]|uniref:Uncharacterized protein n=1 Tax=Holotrichia oblita TaxID=644536 RepID=A0ACB9T695_HOLOL|nr:hypothetical protein MML48_5g00018399 [Holotrichia oblita]
MDDLPVEVIEIILSNNSLTINDVLNFGATCSRLRNIINVSNVTWRKKFMQKLSNKIYNFRWPDIYRLIENESSNWLYEFKYAFDFKRKILNILSSMSPRFYTKIELSDLDFEEWMALLNERWCNYDYLVLELIDIINNTSPIHTIDIVPITKVLRYVRQARLAEEWNYFLEKPEQDRTLEKGATIIAQWFQPEQNIHWKDIAKIFDNITNMVREHLYYENSNHPLFKVPETILEKWKVTNLEDNEWDSEHCRQILKSMKYILCEKLGFCGNTNNYYMPQNSYINEVLENKQGLPITLGIIYESIGRRLGINCEPISSPAHFLLRFSEGRKPHSTSYYIDVFNKGEIIRSSGCMFSHGRDGRQGPTYPRATALEVVERMANNLEVALRDHAQTNGGVTLMKSVLEFLVLVTPQDLTTIVYLARLYMTYNMDTSRLEKLIMSRQFPYPEQAQRVLNMLRGYEAHTKYNKVNMFNQNEPMPRQTRIKFAVGMVMQHRNYNYKCVICDWHPTCMATIDWQKQMNVEKLRFAGNQPFYSVLVEDGSKRYVAQENLETTDDTGFLYLNEDIGRHFSHFFQTHYVPNAEKEKEYPEDSECTPSTFNVIVSSIIVMLHYENYAVTIIEETVTLNVEGMDGQRRHNVAVRRLEACRVECTNRRKAMDR